MSRRPVFESPEQLRTVIRELSQDLGPDHVRVKRLKTGLSKKVSVKEAVPFPAVAQSADQLNEEISAERGRAEAARRSAAAAELSKSIVLHTEIDAALRALRMPETKK